MISEITPHEQFLRDEFHGLTLGATMQRSRIYRAGIAEHERSSLHSTLKRVIDAVAPAYAVPVGDTDHVTNICSIAETITRAHAPLLRDGRFRLGPAQKALNLFLKYLWCAGTIPIPPHCPFDYLIISKLEKSAQCRWTELDDVSQYQRLVDAARQQARGVPLAQWELELYNDVSVAGRRRGTEAGHQRAKSK
jgi:hypothetical protein